MADRFQGYKLNNPKVKNTSSSTALTAVALQDHWVRTLSLGKSFQPKQVGISKASRYRQKKEVKSVVDCGRGKKVINKIPNEDEEFVLDAKPPPLTLAQKFGLIDAPRQLLTEAEWHGVKVKSNKRDDSQQPCVICKEDFGLQQQVLLSCSHVFHRACLQAFERYTGKKTCPMCRHEQYQSRVIHEGSKQHRLKCAIRIQAAWRGYVVRCWYIKFRQSVPPTDVKLRKKFFEEKLQCITDRMVKSCDFNLNDFLHEIDASLAASRNVFKNFDAMFNLLSDDEWEQVQLKAVIRENVDCPICLQSLEVNDMKIDLTSTDNKTETKRIYKSNSANVTSNKKITKQVHAVKSTKLSENCDCEATVGMLHKRQTVLLSCSHVFHDICLTTLEKLTEVDLKNICPVCRTVYQKKCIDI